MFDGVRELEFMIRWPLWIREFFLRKRKLPENAIPSFSQPIHCTRRAFDYLGFLDCVEKEQVKIVDVSSQGGISGFAEKGILANDALWEFDLVIVAIGFEVGQINHPIYVDGELVHVGLEMAYRWNMFGKIPNFFLPAAGGPLLTIPPRVVEDNVPYLIKLIKYMHQENHHEFRLNEAEIARAMWINSSVVNFLKKHSVVFSPHCKSLRYVITPIITPDQQGAYQTIRTFQDKSQASLLSPFPRFLTNLDMYFNFKYKRFSFK